MKINEKIGPCRYVGKPRQIVRIMKITILIMTVCLLQVSALTKAQISIDAKQESLREVLKKISQQSGYDFIYSVSDFKDAKPVDLKLNNVSLDLALRAAFYSQPLIYEVSDQTVMVRKKEEKTYIQTVIDRFQAIDVRGKVVDSLGNGLPGASVSVKNGKRSISTAANGDFELKNVDEGAVLVFNYLGFVSKEVPVSKEFVYVQLQPSSSKLDEIQVIAYGKTTRRLSSGNVSSLKSEDIEKQPVNNPLLALAGRIPGMIVTQSSGLPGSAVKVEIRGRNSLNDSKPLFIIDGLPYDNDMPAIGGPLGGIYDGTLSAFNFINPNNIESIEVLKDADATAIYGSRGANGVVLVTTKKGRAGNTKLSVNLQSGVGEVSRKMKLLNRAEYLSMRREAFSNDGTIFDPTDIYKAFAAPDLFYWDTTRYTNWQKDLIGGTAHFNDFQSSISGGSANLRYLVGGNFHHENTVFPGNTGDNKASAHFSITGSSNNQKLTATLTGSFMSNWNSYAREDYTKYIAMSPVAPNPFLEDGTLNWQPFLGFGIDEYQFASFTNPYSKLFQPFNSNIRNLTSSTLISYKILPSLSVKTNIGYSLMSGSSYTAVNPYESLPSQDIVNGTILRESQFGSNSKQSFIVEPQIDYSFNIGKGILNALVGGSFQNSDAESQTIYARGFSVDNLMENPAAASSSEVAKRSNQYKYAALFTRLNYNWNNKYILNANFRRDGSSRFGPKNRFGNFASVGTAWIFSGEEFVKDKFSFLSFGKIRASYGTSGNDGIPDYSYLERYGLVNNSYQGVKGLITKGLYNPYFSWEETRKSELGLDIGLFSDRILLQSALYRNRSSNQLVNQPLPTISGPGGIIINLPALIQNSGVEFSVNTTNFKTKYFTWTSVLNFSRNKNVLLEFPGIEQTSFYTASGYRIGQQIGGVAVYQFGGVDQTTGQYQFKDRNGSLIFNPSDADRIGYVNTSPQFFGGFSNSFTFKKLTLDIFFQGVKQKGKNYLFGFNDTPGTLDGGTLSNQPIEVLQRWQNSNQNSNIQKFTTTNTDLSNAYRFAQQSDQAYSDASFIRLKNLSVSYFFDLPKLEATKLKVFILGQNLFTFTKFKGLDPESQSVTSLPPLKMITGGLQLTF